MFDRAAQARVVTRAQLRSFFDLLPGEVGLLAQAVRRGVRRALQKGAKLREEFERLDAEHAGVLGGAAFAAVLRSHAGLALSAHDEQPVERSQNTPTHIESDVISPRSIYRTW